MVNAVDELVAIVTVRSTSDVYVDASEYSSVIGCVPTESVEIVNVA